MELLPSTTCFRTAQELVTLKGLKGFLPFCKKKGGGLKLVSPNLYIVNVASLPPYQ